MQSRSLMRAAGLACALVSVVACTGNPPEGSSAYKTGSLGNGGFVFACTDGVACDEFSTGDAADFPKHGVALGSTFNISYIPKDDQNKPALENPTDTIGVTVKALEPFFNGGPDGITANNREGYGAILAQQANGVVADFISLQVVRPASLTIYNAQTTIFSQATDVGSTFTLKVGDTHDFRAVAKDAGNNILAGSLASSWQSDKEAVVSVSVNGGVATVHGLAAGTANLTLQAASFSRTLPITVTP